MENHACHFLLASQIPDQLAHSSKFFCQLINYDSMPLFFFIFPPKLIMWNAILIILSTFLSQPNIMTYYTWNLHNLYIFRNWIKEPAGL
jgi:hypothetical protein